MGCFPYLSSDTHLMFPKMRILTTDIAECTFEIYLSTLLFFIYLNYYNPYILKSVMFFNVFILMSVFELMLIKPYNCKGLYTLLSTF